MVSIHISLEADHILTTVKSPTTMTAVRHKEQHQYMCLKMYIHPFSNGHINVRGGDEALVAYTSIAASPERNALVFRCQLLLKQ